MGERGEKGEKAETEQGVSILFNMDCEQGKALFSCLCIYKIKIKIYNPCFSKLHSTLL